MKKEPTNISWTREKLHFPKGEAMMNWKSPGYIQNILLFNNNEIKKNNVRLNYEKNK